MGRRDKQREFLRLVSTCSVFLRDLKAGSISCLARNELQELGRIVGLEQNCNERLVFELVGKSDYGDLKAAILLYQRQVSKKRMYIRQTKRGLVSALNLRSDALPYAELGVDVVQRERIYFPGIKTRWHLIDRGNEGLCDPMQRYFVVDDVDGWYTVPSNESKIFVDEKGEIQLVVLRDVTKLPDLLGSVNSVIKKAVSDRRNVRPGHDGSMVQYGWNAGSRTCRVWGLVNNFKSADSLSDTEKQRKDRDILGVLAIAWQLFRVRAPKEVVQCVEAAIKDSGMPEMSGRYDEDKQGYTIHYLGHVLKFPYAARAPCEGYLAFNYAAPVHTDRTYSKYSFSWITRHDDTGVVGNTSGGNYIDVSLGVRVCPARDTLLIFCPNYLHGTTKCDLDVKRSGVVVTFTARIKEAYDRAVKNDEMGIACEIEPVDETV